MKIKKIISSLFLASMALFTFNACSDVPAPYDIPGTGDNTSIYGEGTMQKPYTVKGAMLNQNGKLGWVKAYIVGYIPSGGDVSSTIPMWYSVPMAQEKPTWWYLSALMTKTSITAWPCSCRPVQSETL